jgi:hypothetical protein
VNRVELAAQNPARAGTLNLGKEVRVGTPEGADSLELSLCVMHRA